MTTLDRTEEAAKVLKKAAKILGIGTKHIDANLPAPDPAKPPSTLDKIRQLAPTHSAAEIAIQLGCSRQWVYSAASKAGIPLKASPLGPYRLRGLSRTVRRAIVLEAQRRGCGVVEVLRDLNAHHWDVDVAEMGGGV